MGIAPDIFNKNVTDAMASPTSFAIAVAHAVAELAESTGQLRQWDVARRVIASCTSQKDDFSNDRTILPHLDASVAYETASELLSMGYFNKALYTLTPAM